MNRRAVLAGGGVLLAFALGGVAHAGQDCDTLPGDLAQHPALDAWLRIDPDGRITLLTGKVELGQGVLTALAQLCAEELAVDVGDIAVVSGDTALTPDEGATAGSFSIAYAGAAVRQVSAEMRELLIERAAPRLGARPEHLTVDKGAVVDPGRGRIGYGALIGGKPTESRATGGAQPRTGARRLIAGRSTPRIDLPAKVTGAVAFLHDLRLPGMVHARVIRRSGPGAKLLGYDEAAITALAGVVTVVHDGDFLAVVATSEWAATKVGAALAAGARWKTGPAPPAADELIPWLLAAPADVYPIATKVRAGAEPVAGHHAARYTRPYQMHAAIGPSVAVARFADGGLDVWTHSQTVFETAAAIAELVGLPKDKVRCRHMVGAGCYGHNGADDAAADAALIAMRLPGRPVRVQWSREDEHGCEPYGAAMAVAVAASVDDKGDVLDWVLDLWSTPHNMRPQGKAGNLLAGQAVAKPFTPSKPARGAPPNYSADRNAIPYYAFPGQRVTTHLIAAQPLRVSSTRSLGAFVNIFATECFVDELARACGADPVAYRLRQLDDARARAVIERAAARFDWAGWRTAPGHGRGIAFARYKNIAAYCAVALEVVVDLAAGSLRLVRACVAVDAGEVVNPDGLTNQIEGGTLQALSWAMKERVRWDAEGTTSRDWRSYPILTFSEAPAVAVDIIDRPGAPFLGAGEAAQGPAGAALANAVADACGARVRDMPVSYETIRRALDRT